MTTTTAYYTEPQALSEIDAGEEPFRHTVTVTTEHPLSSYGQPVVLIAGSAIPAQSFTHRLFAHFGSDEDLVARANRLAGRSSPSVADQVAAFSGLFR